MSVHAYLSSFMPGSSKFLIFIFLYEIDPGKKKEERLTFPFREAVDSHTKCCDTSNDIQHLWGIIKEKS